jgi:hypothetical protein
MCGLSRLGGSSRSFIASHLTVSSGLATSHRRGNAVEGGKRAKLVSHTGTVMPPNSRACGFNHRARWPLQASGFRAHFPTLFSPGSFNNEQMHEGM